MVGQEVGGSHLEGQAQSRENNWKWLEAFTFSKPAPVAYFLQQGHCLTDENSATN